VASGVESSDDTALTGRGANLPDSDLLAPNRTAPPWKLLLLLTKTGQEEEDEEQIADDAAGDKDARGAPIETDAPAIAAILAIASSPPQVISKLERDNGVKSIAACRCRRERL
jgi:hypothetical protein